MNALLFISIIVQICIHVFKYVFMDERRKDITSLHIHTGFPPPFGHLAENQKNSL